MGEGIWDDHLAELRRQIERHGLTLKEAKAALIDATSIEPAALPRLWIEAPKDRSEGKFSDDPKLDFSTDPGAW